MSNTKAEGEERAIKKAFKEDYPLIPMKDITDEARMIAVAWCDGYKPMGSINLEQKHKLASDIMNYARRVLDEGKGDEKDKAVEVKWRKFYEQEMTLMQEAINRAALIMDGQQQEIERLKEKLKQYE